MRQRTRQSIIGSGSAIAAAIFALGVSFAAHPAMADDPSPDVSASQVTLASATVQRIDKSSRMVTLKDHEGHLHEIKAGDSINLDQLKAGEMVNATYYEEIALALRRPGEPAPKVTQTVTEGPGVTARQASLSAKVMSVNPDENTITVRGPHNRIHTLVAENPDIQAQLRQLKAGDTIDVTYTQAMAVSLTPAPKR